MATDSPGFIKDSQTVLSGLLRFGDCAVVTVSALAAYRLRTDSFALPGLYVSATILGVLLTANFMHMAHVYAITNLRRICEGELRGQYKLEIIDVLEHPQVAEEDRILATPTLIKQLPPPLRRVIGDLSDKDKVLLGLEVQPPVAPSAKPTD